MRGRLFARSNKVRVNNVSEPGARVFSNHTHMIPAEGSGANDSDPDRHYDFLGAFANVPISE
jgi:hypothetical protein